MFFDPFLQYFIYLDLVIMFSYSLKSGSHLPKKICVICIIENSLKMMKNAFYFI